MPRGLLLTSLSRVYINTRYTSSNLRLNLNIGQSPTPSIIHTFHFLTHRPNSIRRPIQYTREQSVAYIYIPKKVVQPIYPSFGRVPLYVLFCRLLLDFFDITCALTMSLNVSIVYVWLFRVMLAAGFNSLQKKNVFTVIFPIFINALTKLSIS